MGKELVVVQQAGQAGNLVWQNVRSNLLQPNEATIKECIGAACLQDTIFFNDLDARSNYRNRIAGIQTACLHTEIMQYPGLLQQLLADRGIPLAPNTEPLKAQLNGVVQLTAHRGMLPEMQAYEYSRRGKVARGVLLLAADNNLTCSLATADEIYRRFGGLTQTAIFERVDSERQKPNGARRAAAAKPSASLSPTEGIGASQAPDQSTNAASSTVDQQIVSGRELGIFDLDFLKAEVPDYGVLAVEKNEKGFKVSLVATGSGATADVCDYVLTFLADGDDRA